ncbi:MAG: hypothetical protein JWQ18_1562 [Conexibacter sp.]|nr:hypothetical protein [Conexibacter sp.]
MAPPRTYPEPPEQLRLLAAVARRQGVDFETFWSAAVEPAGPVVTTATRSAPEGVILWPTDHGARMNWQTAMKGSRAAWRRAYEGEEPSPRDTAVTTLWEALAESDDTQSARHANSLFAVVA